jgi:DNA-binding transcriptional LysR family regulator
VTLLDRHPRLRIQLDAAVGYADLTRREADIALRAFRPSSGDLIARRLVVAPSCILAHPELAARIGTLDDLSTLRWISYTDALAHIPDAAWILDQVPEDSVVLRSDSAQVQLLAAQHQLGVTVMAEASGRHDGLVPVPLCPRLARTLRPFPEQELWLVGHRALRTVPRVQAVWEFLVELFESGLSLEQSS